MVDAIDTVTGKIQLVMEAKRTDTPIISSMGAGNKMDPSAFRVADLSETKVCPLAKVMRRELKKRGVEHLKVVYSEETPMRPCEIAEESSEPGSKRIPGSNAFVPPVAGLIIAGEVVRELSGAWRRGNGKYGIWKTAKWNLRGGFPKVSLAGIPAVFCKKWSARLD